MTGTFAGVVPVHTVDGRRSATATRGPMVERLQDLYAELVAPRRRGPGRAVSQR